VPCQRCASMPPRGSEKASGELPTSIWRGGGWGGLAW
jgi:hypothetical protein